MAWELILAPAVAVGLGAAWHQYWRGDREWWVFLAVVGCVLVAGAATVWLTF